jgi:hypothetical protein
MMFQLIKDFLFVVDCWNIEPDNRPTINQVVDELKVIITKENIIIKDSQLCNDLDVEDSENANSLHGDLSQIIQNFNMINLKEIEPSMLSSNHQIENEFNIIVDDIINFLEGDDYGVGKQKILNYFDNHNINLQEINNLLSNNPNNPNSIVILGIFNYLGIGVTVNKQKAFKFHQKAANLGNS